MEPLEGGALLEDVHHRRQSLRVDSLPHLELTLCFMNVFEDVISQLPAPAASYHAFPTVMGSLPLER